MTPKSWRGRFVRYLLGRGLATVGFNLGSVILGFAVLSVGGDALSIGVVLACSYGAQALILPVSGLFADRLPRRSVAVAANLFQAAVQLAMGGLLLAIPGSVSVWMFAAAATLTGAAGASARPAYEGMVVELVPVGSLQRANAALRMVLNLAKVAIPGAGALIGAVFGFGQVLLAAGVAFIFCSWVLRALPPGQLKTEPVHWLRDAREGWSAFASRSWLWLFVLQGALAVPLWLAGYQLLGPVLVAEQPGGLQFWGWAVSSFGAGLILGSVLAVWWRPRRLMLAAACCSLLWPLPLAVLALDVHLGWLLVAMLVCGVGMDLAIVFYNTARQQQVPASLISRVVSISFLAEIALVPAGYLLGGLVATLVGARPVMWICFVGISITTVALLAVPSIRNLSRVDQPAPQDRPLATAATQTSR